MKQSQSEQLKAQQLRARRKAADSLTRAFLNMESESDCLALLKDLTTPAELEAIIDRWRVVLLLDEGMHYRAIHDQTGVSVTTIGRVARFLQEGAGGYRKALTLREQARTNSSKKQAAR